ncbi:hypothetical protein MesoLj113b_35390 [Mesorhizobium sp. 113-3-3]|nr:hypothetical protein MesoLj113b_35390 [Mesorhizobium sp. 113-3-3]
MQRLAPFLSLRRGERWRREAATEWGKAFMKRAVAAKQAQLSERATFGKRAIKQRHCFGLN